MTGGDIIECLSSASSLELLGGEYSASSLYHASARLFTSGSAKGHSGPGGFS